MRIHKRNLALLAGWILHRHAEFTSGRSARVLIGAFGSERVASMMGIGSDVETVCSSHIVRLTRAVGRGKWRRHVEIEEPATAGESIRVDAFQLARLIGWLLHEKAHIREGHAAQVLMKVFGEEFIREALDVASSPAIAGYLSGRQLQGQLGWEIRAWCAGIKAGEWDNFITQRLGENGRESA